MADTRQNDLAVSTTPRAGAAAIQVVIGLDFGTSSTKVVVRRRGESRAEVIAPTWPAPSHPWFVTPSVVRVKGGRLSFGTEALTSLGGVLLRSLKVKLLDTRVTTIRIGTEEVSVDLLVTIFLIRVLGDVRARLDERHGTGGYRVYLNLAAPMSHLEDRTLKERYLRIAGAVYESVFGAETLRVGEDSLLAELRSRFSRAFSPDAVVPDQSIRRYDVLPETIAPLVSLLHDPATDPGMYAVVDVGAGTTEMSISCLKVESNGRRTISCYHDETQQLGGDDFDRADSQAPDLHEATAKELVTRFRKQFNRTWESGRRKDAALPWHVEQWGETTVILTGGGAHRAPIDQHLNLTNRSDGPWRQMCSGSRRFKYAVRWHRPSSSALEFPLAPDASNDERSEIHLLAVAHGLSFHRQEWPIVYPPESVEVQEGREQIERPEPGWYQSE